MKNRGTSNFPRGILWIGLIVTLSFFYNTLSAQVPEFIWAQQVVGGAADNGYDIATDGLNNVVITGKFSNDIFIAKYDPFGQLLWSKQVIGGGTGNGFGIAIDGSNNIVITGNFRGTVTFGAGEPNEINLTSTAGSDDIFIAKYDPLGNLIWAKGAGGLGNDYGYGITTDGADDIILTGEFALTGTFGSGEPNETNLISTGARDIFVAKYDVSGDLIWAKKAGGVSRDTGMGIATDASGNTIITGDIEGTATFGPNEPNETIITPAGSNDIFIAKYDVSGNLVWIKQANGTFYPSLNPSIDVDNSSNIFVSGIFFGSAIFGPGEPNETTLISAGISELFHAKYDPLGNLIWVKQTFRDK